MENCYRRLLLAVTVALAAAAAVATPAAASTFNEYTIPSSSSAPIGITTGPDGALWFTEENGNKIGRITTAGTITVYPLPAGNNTATGIAAGSDNALWFSNDSANIGRMYLSAALDLTPAANIAMSVRQGAPVPPPPAQYQLSTSPSGIE